MKRVAVAVMSVVGVALSTGCTVTGPSRLEAGHVLYNQAVNLTTNEQLLLNLVRLRYRDTPTFLQVSSISTQYSLSASAGVSADFDRHEGLTDYGGSIGLDYSEKPTISFAPLQGDKFVSQMLSPIAPQTLALLYQSGWNVSRVTRCTVQGINGIDNAPNASSPTPATAPVYEEFKRVTELFRALQVGGHVELGIGAGEEEGKLYLRIAPEATDSPEMKELSRLLGLPAGRTQYEIVASVIGAGDGQIGVDMRSALGVLYFLSHGVEVPPAHEERGLVTVTRRANGERFDWGDVSGGLLRVRWSKGQPAEAAVKIKYRDVWFYIADSDLEAKSTFTLLGQILALQAGGLPTATPVLTIPIG